MTRTNRQPGELPFIPPPLEPYPAPDAIPTRGPDDLGAMAMLTACLIAGGAVVLVIVIGVAVHAQITARIDRLQADLRALHTFATCDAPAKPGDTTVITIRRTDHHQLATRCQVITNPRAPERALQ